jgi:hypothetical protein
LGACQIPAWISPPSDRGVYLVLWVEDLSRVLDCLLVSQTHLSTLLLLFLIGETPYLIAWAAAVRKIVLQLFVAV